MSATTKSLLLLAALGVAACDSSNSSTTTPTPSTESETPVEPTPEEETPVEPTAEEIAAARLAEITTETDAAAIEERDAGDDAELAVAFQDAEEALADLTADETQALALLDQLVALAATFDPDALTAAQTAQLEALADQIVEVSPGVIVIDAVGSQALSDYVAGVQELFDADEDGAIAAAFVAALETAADDVKAKQEALNSLDRRDGLFPNARITLADGTVLQTAGAAVYTRVDGAATEETVLTPTASIVVAYQVDERGLPTEVEYYNAGGIAFEGLPEEATFVSGSGDVYAFVEVDDLGGAVMSGGQDIVLNLNAGTGTISAGMGGGADQWGADLLFNADLTFDPQTGIFSANNGNFNISGGSSSGDFDLTTNTLDLEGSLRGLSEAYSGTFQINTDRINADGGFLGTSGEGAFNINN